MFLLLDFPSDKLRFFLWPLTQGLTMHHWITLAFFQFANTQTLPWQGPLHERFPLPRQPSTSTPSLV